MSGKDVSPGQHTARRKQKVINEFKNRPCERCGGQFPHYVMDCHHKEGTEKNSKLQVSGKNNTFKYALCHLSWPDLADELAKCAVVCANCHRIIEHEKRSA